MNISKIFFLFLLLVRGAFAQEIIIAKFDVINANIDGIAWTKKMLAQKPVIVLYANFDEEGIFLKTYNELDKAETWGILRKNELINNLSANNQKYTISLGNIKTL